MYLFACLLQGLRNSTVEFLLLFVTCFLVCYRGSVIAKIVGNNVAKNDKYDNTVTMYVYEEMIDGKKLTEIINTQHENVKYLPGHKLPTNVVSK